MIFIWEFSGNLLLLRIKATFYLVNIMHIINSIKKRLIKKYPVIENVVNSPIFSRTNSFNLSDYQKEQIKKRIKEFSYTPKFKIVLFIDNAKVEAVSKTIDSIVFQLYENWNLTVLSDNSSDSYLSNCFEIYTKIDPRISFIHGNPNAYQENLNSSYKDKSDEFVMFLNQNQVLSLDNLYSFAYALNNNPELKLLYSDEAYTDVKGNCLSAYFKGDWNSALFLRQNFISNSFCISSEKLRDVSDLNIDFCFNQTHEFFFNLVKNIDENSVCHIDRVLFKYIQTNAQTNSKTNYSSDSSLSMKVEKGSLSDLKTNPKISIVISAQSSKQLIHCVDGILNNTDYSNYCLIVDGIYADCNFLSLYKSLLDSKVISIISMQEKSNLSAFFNSAEKIADGEFFLFLNSAFSVSDKEWLSSFIKKFEFYSEHGNIGIIGSKILNRDGTVYHAGYVTGINKVAGSAFRNVLSSDYYSYLNTDRYVSAVSGDCLFVKKSVFNEINGFDEKLNYKFFDVDLCLKAREHRYKVLYTPDVCLSYDLIDKDIKDSIDDCRLYNSDSFYMISKYGDSLRYDPFYNSNLTLDNELYSLAEYPRKNKSGFEDRIDILCPFHRGDVIVGLAVALTYALYKKKKVVFHVSKSIYNWICPYLFKELDIRIVDIGLPSTKDIASYFSKAAQEVIDSPDFSGYLAVSHPKMSFDDSGTGIVQNLLLETGLPQDTKLVRNSFFTQKSKKSKIVLLHPYGSWQLKSFNSKQIKQLVEICHEFGLSVVQIGGRNDKKAEYCDDYYLSNENIACWKELFSKCTCLIGVDSWSSHFAAFCDVPHITFFGSTSARYCSTSAFYKDSKSRYYIIDSSCELSPCNKLYCVKNKKGDCAGYKNMSILRNILKELLNEK